MLSPNDIGNSNSHRHLMGWFDVCLVKLSHFRPVNPRCRWTGSLRCMGAVLRQTPYHPDANIQQSNGSHGILAKSNLRSQYLGVCLLPASLFSGCQRILNHHIRSGYPAQPLVRCSSSSSHRIHIEEARIIPQDTLGWMEHGCLRSRHYDST